MFKVGDKVRRVKGINAGTTIGFEGVIREVYRDVEGDTEYRFDDGAWGYADWNGAEWELVAPTGPVVTETVTKTRIVPGVYDRITVNDEGKAGMVGLWLNNGHYFSADQLDAAAAVLSALAKGLRDVD